MGKRVGEEVSATNEGMNERANEPSRDNVFRFKFGKVYLSIAMRV